MGNPQAAAEIGRKAVASGLETLDLARIHIQALAALLKSIDSHAERADATARAVEFFTEAILPIEETHRAALKATANLDHLRAALDQLTLELASANGELQQQVTARAAVEADLQHSKRSSSQLLKDSQVLEQHLQNMTRQILVATEGEQLKMSLQLNDVIAQTLLGIHLRILALHNEVTAKRADLNQEISATRRLVAKSAKIISRAAHEFNARHER